MTQLLRSAILLLLINPLAQASPVTEFTNGDWIQIGADDGVDIHGFVDPGWGGQKFDAEYLYVRLQDTTLSVGLQTGFNLDSGHVNYKNKNYYAGDLALSFDGDNDYEYAIDFGLYTEGYRHGSIDAGSNTGKDEAGLYQVTDWNNDIYFQQSVPFAMDSGTKVADLSENSWYQEADSYYRIASFDLTTLGLTEINFSAHWTMSCGNDVVEGPMTKPVRITTVTEPSPLPLIGIGFIAMLILRRKENR